MNPRAALILCVFSLTAPDGLRGQVDTLFVDNGKVGVGISSPAVPLHVVATGAPANTVLQVENDGPARFRFKNTVTGETWNVGHQSPSGTGLVFSDVGDAVSELLVDVNGNLIIAGTITTAGGTYPDHVFTEGYPLLPLPDLRRFIDEHRHLPGIPTAGEVAAQGGVNMSELQLGLLKKVEELTLYALAQEEALHESRAALEALEHSLRERDARLAELELRRHDLESRLDRIERSMPSWSQIPPAAIVDEDRHGDAR